ncbi:MAG: rhodanese-like domain-containing protein [Thermanaerothrix sp.]|nr:rhodanese-like domain-containing protein [Thermanaerothrix sp.]
MKTARKTNKQPETRSWRRIAPWVFILIGLGLMLYGAWGFLAQNRPQPTTTIGNSANVPYPEVERIALEEAKRAYDEGSAVFLDVRPASAYAASHIPGALNIPVNELPQRINELDPTRPIITYCT